MSAGTNPRKTDHHTCRKEIYVALIALFGVVIGSMVTFFGQSFLATQSAKNEREDRLWRERVSAYSSFDLASLEFMQAENDSDQDGRKKAHENLRASLGPVSILGGTGVLKAASAVHLAESIALDTEKPSNRELDDLSTARSDFKTAVRKELGVSE